MDKAELTLAFTRDFDALHKPLRLLAAKPDRFGDVQIELALPRGTQLALTCLMVNRGTPERLNQALRRRAQLASPTRLAVVAPSWSKPLLAFCQQSNLAAFDLDGNHVLVSRSARFDKVDRPRALESSAPSDYSGKAAAIAIALLREPDRIRTQAVIARQAGVDQSWVSRVAKALADKDCVEVSRVGRRGVKVLSPAAVLDVCQHTYSPKVLGGLSRAFALPDRVERVEHALAAYCSAHGLAYAFTAYSAAARHGSVGPYDRVVLYVDAQSPQLDKLASALKLKPARNGQLVIWKPASPVVLSAVRTIAKERVVDPVLCYLDMWVMPGRGRDHARAFRSTVLPEEFL